MGLWGMCPHPTQLLNQIIGRLVTIFCLIVRHVPVMIDSCQSRDQWQNMHTVRHAHLWQTAVNHMTNNRPHTLWDMSQFWLTAVNHVTNDRPQTLRDMYQLWLTAVNHVTNDRPHTLWDMPSHDWQLSIMWQMTDHTHCEIRPVMTDSCQSCDKWQTTHIVRHALVMTDSCQSCSSSLWNKMKPSWTIGKQRCWKHDCESSGHLQTSHINLPIIHQLQPSYRIMSQCHFMKYGVCYTHPNYSTGEYNIPVYLNIKNNRQNKTSLSFKPDSVT